MTKYKNNVDNILGSMDLLSNEDNSMTRQDHNNYARHRNNTKMDILVGKNRLKYNSSDIADGDYNLMSSGRYNNLYASSTVYSRDKIA